MKQVTLPQIERRLALAEGQTIVAAALAAGIPYPHGCTAGRCAACKSRLHSGSVKLKSHTRFALSEEEKADGLILACRAMPDSDVSVSWLGEAAADAAGAPQGASVVAIEQMTHDIRRLFLKLDDRAGFRFTAGQYLNLTVDGAPARPYSMASRPDEDLVEHFCEMTARHAHVAYHVALSMDASADWHTGRMSELVAANHTSLAGSKAYVAGPPAMLDAVQAVLVAQGMAPDDIHADSFFTPENI